ncbi:MAG: ABC transporter permease [Spirochaetia bacterium]|nr:ABC transporter permease [Spirochaetia bacterium]
MIYISRRTDVSLKKAIAIKVIAILLSLVVCALVLFIMTRLNPLDIYIAMFKGSFSTQRKFWALLQNTAILLCIALAVTPAFKMRFWNLGAEGQVLMGALVSATFMFYIQDGWPSWLLILVMLVTSVIAGLIWAGIPGFFKAKFGTNETLFTLMMNYVAIQLVKFCIAVWVPNGSSVMGVLNRQTQCGWIPSLFGQKYLINILTVATLTVLMFIYLKYSKQGYEISVVGESEKTARYIGINVKKVIMRTACISGAIGGLAGFLLCAGTGHTVSATLAGGNGFTAVLVSWLAKFNPFGMVLTSLLIVFLQKGSGEIAQAFRLSDNISDVTTGIILFFIIGSEFFTNYRIHLRRK